MLSKLKKIFLIIILIIFSFFLYNTTNAGTIFGEAGSNKPVPYCAGADGCGGITGGMEEVKKNLGDEIVKDKTAVEYVQDIVKYLLTFVTLTAVIYIIYAGFRILTSSGEDEIIKTSKKTILYVIIGIVLIWFAYEIAYWATTIGEKSGNNSGGGYTNNGGSNSSTSCEDISNKTLCQSTLVCDWRSSRCTNR